MITYQATLQGDTLQQLIASYAQAPQITATHTMAAMNKSLVNYQGTARQIAPIDQGLLRASIQISPARHEGNRIEGSVGTALNYAPAQEAGSGIYGPTGQPIRPKTKKVLAWYSGGSWHFAKEVKGVRPRWYMRGSLERNQARTDAYFATASHDIATALAGGR